jgi:hypothetical protein
LLNAILNISLQKVHARQFHVISQCSSRQDQAFQAITKTISDWTTTQRSALGLDAKLRVGSLPPGGESPIADVWGQLADYVEYYILVKAVQSN